MEGVNPALSSSSAQDYVFLQQARITSATSLYVKQLNDIEQPALESDDYHLGYLRASSEWQPPHFVN